QAELRTDLCRALQNLVDTNKAITELEGEEDLVAQSRVSKADAKNNLDHLAGFASNLLAVLFNVYSQTLPQYRGIILRCINAYLSITPEKVSRWNLYIPRRVITSLTGTYGHLRTSYNTP